MSETVFQLISSALSLSEPKKDDSINVPTISITEISDPVEETEDQVTAPMTNDIDVNVTHIQSSPYDDPANFLDLRELTSPERLLAIALTYLKSSRPDYATAPYMESFNWSAVFSILRTLCQQSGIEWKRHEFYLVIFRSRLRTTADRVRLGELDKKSHEEACASGGLLTYWFGSPNAEMRNLATCELISSHCVKSTQTDDIYLGIWRNREDAAAGGKGPWHRKARGAAREMYEEISFHTHKFLVGDGAETWCLGPYRG